MDMRIYCWVEDMEVLPIGRWTILHIDVLIQAHMGYLKVYEWEVSHAVYGTFDEKDRAWY
jgi:hypothetical protein